jgi:hypothetical protein
MNSAKYFNGLLLIVSLAMVACQTSQSKVLLPAGGSACAPPQILLSATKELKHPKGTDLGLTLDGQNFPVGTWSISVKTAQGFQLVGSGPQNTVTVGQDGILRWGTALTGGTAANISCGTPLTAFAALGNASNSATSDVVCPGQ